jgi:hypothetical protein
MTVVIENPSSEAAIGTVIEGIVKYLLQHNGFGDSRRIKASPD